MKTNKYTQQHCHLIIFGNIDCAKKMIKLAQRMTTVAKVYLTDNVFVNNFWFCWVYQLDAGAVTEIENHNSTSALQRDQTWSRRPVNVCFPPGQFLLIFSQYSFF